MLIFYQVLFFTGLFFTVATFLLGRIGGHGHDGGADGSGGTDVHGVELHGTEVHGVELHGAELHGAELHGAELHGTELHGHDFHGADAHGHDFADGQAHHHTDGGGLDGLSAALLPFKISCIVFWMTITGGIGMLMVSGYGWLLTLCVAVFAGYVGAVLLNGLVLIPLAKSQNTSAAERREMLGREAVVTSAIIENGYGRIRYEVRGKTYNAPARHIGGKRVEQNEQVVIRALDGATHLIARPLESAGERTEF